MSKENRLISHKQAGEAPFPSNRIADFHKRRIPNTPPDRSPRLPKEGILAVPQSREHKRRKKRGSSVIRHFEPFVPFCGHQKFPCRAVRVPIIFHFSPFTFHFSFPQKVGPPRPAPAPGGSLVSSFPPAIAPSALT
jgi:hypothetical protein